jgi:hypothetical protein
VGERNGGKNHLPKLRKIQQIIKPNKQQNFCKTTIHLKEVGNLYHL